MAPSPATWIAAFPSPQAQAPRPFQAALPRLPDGASPRRLGTLPSGWQETRGPAPPTPRPAPPPRTLAVAVWPAQDGTLLDVPEGLKEAAHIVLRLLLVEHAHEEFSIFWNKIRRCLPGPGARLRGAGPGGRARPEVEGLRRGRVGAG